MTVKIEILNPPQNYTEARQLVKQLKKLNPTDVVQYTTFLVRRRWALPRLDLLLQHLESQAADAALGLLSQGKTIANTCAATGLPERKVRKISLEFRKTQRQHNPRKVINSGNKTCKYHSVLDLWITNLSKDHENKLQSAGLPVIQTIS